jgi:OmpA-OmpF porin, OOP family
MGRSAEARAALACFGTFGFLGAALAADEQDKVYVDPIYGYALPDESHAVENDAYAGVGFGHHLGRRWSVELNLLEGRFPGAAGRELEQSAVSVDALRVFGRANRVSPYVTFGAGRAHNELDTGADSGELVQAGAGLLIDLAENDARTFVFQLRPEIKYRVDRAGPASDNNNDYLISLGFAMNYGGRRQVAPQQSPPSPPPPAPAAPVDSDGDGVLDATDRCSGTPRAVAVDTAGCPRPEPVVLRGVEFEFDSPAVAPGWQPVLEGVAGGLQQHPRLRIELQGHTDSRGPDAYNLRLSQRRAESVRERLIANGASASQLVAKGYGETQPVGDNDTAAGRASNRRVVMAVLENPDGVEVQGAP